MTRLQEAIEKQRAIEQSYRDFQGEISKTLLAEQAVRDRLEHGEDEDGDE